MKKLVFTLCLVLGSQAPLFAQTYRGVKKILTTSDP